MTADFESLLVPDWARIVRIKMISKGHNKSSLARALDVSVPHVSNILKGKGSDAQLQRVCDVLDFEIAVLLKEEYRVHAGADQDKAESG